MTKHTGEPVYQTISGDLRSQIMHNSISPGTMLPSENELSARYDTTRATVRKSLQILEHEGLIYSWPGKGYYVSEPRHNTFTFEFPEDEWAGSDVTIKNIRIIHADEEIRHTMNLSETACVVEICRIIRNETTAVAYDIKYIPYRKGIPLLESEINYSVFPEIMAQHSAPFAFHTKMEIGIEPIPVEITNILACPAGEPAIVLYRYFMDKQNTCIGYGKKYIRSAYGRLKAESGYPDR